MHIKRIVTLTIIAMFAFLFVSEPIMKNSVVSARPVADEVYVEGGSGSGETVDSEALDCNGYFNNDLGKVLDAAYLILQVLAVALTVVLGMLDFGKAVWSNDQDLLKKASNKFIKRLVAMVVIILLPFIIDPIVEKALGVGDGTCSVGSGSYEDFEDGE